MKFLEDIKDAEDKARDELQLLDKKLDDLLPQYGPGFRAPKDSELPRFLAMMRQQYPPAEWVLPDGRVVHESIYLLALPYVEGGRELLEKVKRVTGGGM